MQLERGVPLLHRAEEILVPLERQIGVVSALQEQLNATDRDGFVDLSEDLVEAKHVAFRVSDGTIKRAEVAARDADVRIVDVAVDDVGDDAIGMAAGAKSVGHPRKQVSRRFSIHKQRVVSRETVALLDFALDLMKRHLEE